MQKSNWKKCKLGEICQLIPGFAFKSKDFGNYCYKVVKIADIQPPKIESEHLTGVNLDNYPIDKLSKYLITYHDFCVAMTGATIGKLGRYQGKVPAYINQRVLLFKATPNAEKNFLYYTLYQKSFQSFIKNHIDSETAQPNISARSISKFEIDLPPIDEQKKIAGVLGAFDDKIELLQKQNITLENMAKALFKSWFVDFDVVHAKQQGQPKAAVMQQYHLTEELYNLFPSSFEPSALGPIPTGWQVKELDFLCKKCQSGGTPSTRKKEYWENGNISWFSTKELQDSFLLDSEKNITKLGLENSSAKLFPKGTVLMAIYASPTVGRLGILTHESTFNQAAVGLIANDKKISKEYLFLLLQHRREDLNNLANGAAQQNLSVGVVKAFKVLYPSPLVTDSFTKQVSNMFNKMESNHKQIQTLTEMRDALLPRLISGKIRV